MRIAIASELGHRDPFAATRMMTDNDIREAIHEAWFAAVVAQAGAKLVLPPKDYGIDALVTEVVSYTDSQGKTRYRDRDGTLSFQLKASSRCVHKGDNIQFVIDAPLLEKYALMADEATHPFYVVVLDLPQDLSQAVQSTEHGVFVTRGCYYFVPKHPQNISQERVLIPKTNLVTPGFITSELRKIEETRLEIKRLLESIRHATAPTHIV